MSPIPITTNEGTLARTPQHPVPNSSPISTKMEERKLEDDKEVTTTMPISASKASKLSAVIGDGSFEAVMKERTKLRKEKDEHSIAELRVSMSNLDRSLSHEIKRRINSAANLESICLNKITEMEDRLNSIIDQRVSTITDQLGMLEMKVDELNNRLEEEKAKIPLDIEKKGKELQAMLSSFQEDFAVERRDRLNREGRIMKQLTDHASLLTEQWSVERSEREDVVSLLKARLDENEKIRSDADASFGSLMERELAKLKQDVERETKERKQEDDEIVAALNRYTDNLQNSLSVIS